MEFTLNPRRADLHDVPVVPPDAVPVAHGDAEFPNLAPGGTGRPSATQARAEPDFSADPAVPPVDTAFRAADVNNVRARGRRPSIGVRVMRGVIGFLLAVCIGIAASLWQSSYGDAAKEEARALVAKWAPQLASLISSPPEDPGAAAQPSPPAVQASEATQQPAAPAQTAADGAAPAAAAPAPESAQLLQSMARDLADARQEIEQLKISITQLKANQDQMSRDVARVSSDKAASAPNRVSEQNLRPRISMPPPRPAAAPARKPASPLRPTQGA